MLERKFNVRLIERTGEIGMKEAWITSKPTLTYKDDADLQGYLDNVINNDLPLTGFHNFTFKIGSSILFRDLVLTLRPIQVWATSSRIVKLENLGMEADYPISKKAQEDYERVVKAQAKGEALDVSKRYCPLQQYTEFCCVLDLRTLVVFCKTVKECDEELFHSHCVPMLEAVGFSEERMELIKSKGIYDKLSIPQKKVATIDECVGLRYQETDLSYELGVKVAFALGAQFIRQHYARVRSSCWNELKEIGYRKMLERYNSSDEFYYVSVGEKEQWQQVCSRRTCFVAQFDWKDPFGWDFIIGKWVDKMTPFEFANNLPCKGCGKNCNIFNETKLRLFTKRADRERWTNNPPDENPPCPLLIEDPSMIDERKRMYHSNSSIFEMWEYFVKKFVPNNPNNLARLFYEGKTDTCPDNPKYLENSRTPLNSEVFSPIDKEKTDAEKGLDQLLNKL